LITISLVLVVFSGKKEGLNDVSQLNSAKSGLVDYNTIQSLVQTESAKFESNPNRKATDVDSDIKKQNPSITDGQISQIRSKFQDENQYIKRVGWQSYLDYLRESKKISHELSSYLSEMYGMVRFKLDKGDCSVVDYNKIIDASVSKAESVNKLSISELNSLYLVASIEKTTYEYLYRQHLLSRASQKLSCNHSTGIGYGLGGAAVGLTVGIFLGAGPLGAGIGGVIGISVWWLTCDPVDCHPPSSLYFEVLDCSGRVRVSGWGGSSAENYNWGNSSNFNITSNQGSTVEGNVIDFNSPFALGLTFECGGTQYAPSGTFNLASILNQPAPSIQIVDGPSIARPFATYRFFASGTSRGIYDLSWEVRGASGGRVSASQDYWADIFLGNPGTFIVVAKVTNRCTQKKEESTWTVVVRS
jgi:hypothetical protein